MPLPDTIKINSQKEKEIIDISETIETDFRNRYPDAKNGLIHIFLQHTSAAITVTDLDPGTEHDLITAYEKMVPEINFKHLHDPKQMPSHVITALMKPGLWLPVYNGKIQLGLWQRIILVELDGPAEREIILSFVKTVDPTAK